jgi:hypothetical protein
MWGIYNMCVRASMYNFERGDYRCGYNMGRSNLILWVGGKRYKIRTLVCVWAMINTKGGCEK